MTMIKKPPLYHTYVLRVWAERLEADEKQAIWRFSLEKTSNGKRSGFTSVKALLANLEKELSKTTQV